MSPPSPLSTGSASARLSEGMYLALLTMTDTASRPADADASSSWIDRAPPGLRPYLRLMRLDRPIGTWLLYWPCLCGAILGAIADDRAFWSLHDLWFAVLFAIGAIVMRGAGCTYNDIVDRD